MIILIAVSIVIFGVVSIVLAVVVLIDFIVVVSIVFVVVVFLIIVFVRGFALASTWTLPLRRFIVADVDVEIRSFLLCK